MCLCNNKSVNQFVAQPNNQRRLGIDASLHSLKQLKNLAFSKLKFNFREKFKGQGFVALFQSLAKVFKYEQLLK